MLAHIGLRVRDLAASTRFYQAILSPLGYELRSRDETSASFGSAEDPALYLYATPRGAASAVHLALRAKRRPLVRAFHERGLLAGGKDHGAPGIRTDYSPNYYAAFLLDPDGNNVEAVCSSAQAREDS